MAEDRDREGSSLSEQQQKVVAHQQGALLVLGVAGSGRTEAVARRLASLTEQGERALALTCSQATVSRIRARSEEVIDSPFEELVVHRHAVAAARLLREHATEAGLDPLFETLSPAERLAMLLERQDELPLRRHEIRGNPTGLLARIVDRIDALKAAGVTAERFRGWTEQLEGEERPDQDAIAREREFAEVYDRHDEMLRSAGAIDAGEAVLELTRLLEERPGLAATVAERFPHLLVDEL
jgi:DNA helicase-2/ATP-dependent DNA helicase PcrA